MSRNFAARMAAGAAGVATVSSFALAAPAGQLTLTSAEAANGKMMAMEPVLNGFGCAGGNVSPGLKWSDAPAGTKSFALTLYDPDAPTGSGWWHWVVYNIPAGVSSLPAGAGDPQKNLLPAGAVQGRTDFGTSGYGGPCPPPGKPHRYVITLTALDIDKLPVPDDASGALVGFNVGAHSLAKGMITAQYGR